MGSPRRDFSHCGGFAPAAPRRAWNLVSGSISGLLLSQPVPINGLVSHYLTNYLIGRRPILRRKKHLNKIPITGKIIYPVLAPVSQGYPSPKGRLSTCYWAVRQESKFFRLAWLNRIPIAVASARIKQIWQKIKLIIVNTTLIIYVRSTHKKIDRVITLKLINIYIRYNNQISPHLLNQHQTIILSIRSSSKTCRIMNQSITWLNL